MIYKEETMRRKKLAPMLLFVGMVVWGCAGTSGSMVTPPKPPGVVNPPVITASFAVDKGRYGDPIKIYLAAEHDRAAMEMIAVQVSQVGYGAYPSNWTYLKEGYRERFVGYLQWNTAGGEFLPEGTRISIDISVLDRWGNESNKIVLPYEFASRRSSPSALPAPFDQADIPRLGYISIVLRNPHRSDGSGR
jgi:hypothetical protein